MKPYQFCSLDSLVTPQNSRLKALAKFSLKFCDRDCLSCFCSFGICALAPVVPSHRAHVCQSRCPEKLVLGIISAFLLKNEWVFYSHEEFRDFNLWCFFFLWNRRRMRLPCVHEENSLCLKTSSSQTVPFPGNRNVQAAQFS